jgi:hypothetical protein
MQTCVYNRRWCITAVSNETSDFRSHDFPLGQKRWARPRRALHAARGTCQVTVCAAGAVRAGCARGRGVRCGTSSGGAGPVRVARKVTHRLGVEPDTHLNLKPRSTARLRPCRVAHGLVDPPGHPARPVGVPAPTTLNAPPHGHS